MFNHVTSELLRLIKSFSRHWYTHTMVIRVCIK